MSVVAVDDVAVDILSIGGTTESFGWVFGNDSGTNLIVGGFRRGPESGTGTFSDYFTGTGPVGALPAVIYHVMGTYGRLTLSTAGAWLYELDETDPDTLALLKGQLASDIFTYRAHEMAGGTPDFAQLTFTIKGVNSAPVIKSNGGGASAKISVHEGGKAVTTVKATDADDTPVTYKITGGADAGKFSINAATGKLTFKSAPDFEAPKDAGRNNVYDVIVSASDGLATDTQKLAVRVKDIGLDFVGGDGFDFVTAGLFGRAGDGNDRLSGRGGNDVLETGAGNDTVDGGAGSDVLKGGRGQDELRGGFGRDLFVFAETPSAANADRIEDFRHNHDLLALQAFSFPNIGWWGPLSSSAFHSGDGVTKAHDRSDRIIYDTSTGRLLFDEDGKGGRAAVLFATLENKPTLDAGDFLIV